MAAMELTRTHRILIGLVIGGAVIIAGIGFAGSYAAVRELAVHKGFGTFSYFFPIGIDAGICVLLALDLLLTWLRIPFPLLRQTAWILTAATIAFNGAAAWPDPLGVGMHAVIPVLFVVAVEAARHAVGRIADITADKHMEGVRLTRWLLSPVPTFRLWRRMKLWELRSYDQVIKLEQERLIYQARLQARFGRGWRRKAPVEALMPLRLARYGVPLAETAPAGLAAAGIDPVLLPPNPVPVVTPLRNPALVSGPAPHAVAPQAPAQTQELVQAQAHAQAQPQGPAPAPQPQEPAQAPQPTQVPQDQGPAPQQAQPNHESPWFDAPQLAPDGYGGAYTAQAEETAAEAIPGDAHPVEPEQSGPELFGVLQQPDPSQEPDPQMEEFREIAYKMTYGFVQEYGRFPTPFELDQLVAEAYGLQQLPEPQSDLLELVTPEVQERVREEMQEYDPS
ncbi:hypothetical protein SNE510_20650 [Streptomyces sp. NE5-10]|uniref:DUF2637 domain-containing protein n=1 Tax=Streptomyces sp. NE5-10 TaxID=2759674 RepID=UPI0019074E01|nr:DUF2637 domain-containing protein [Streptomyces sp. NE5-10]GHJ92546.1 hypothetical protein SNE510_20650 [Streptomyces sp. NE5-10]